MMQQSGCLPCQQAALVRRPVAGVGAINGSSAASAAWSAIALAAGAAGAYHGYKRNRSAGWAFGWFLFGMTMPFFSVPLSLAQGYSKPKKGRRR